MDGFGMEGPSAGNAVVNASTPNLDRIFSQCPGSRLSASGLDVSNRNYSNLSSAQL